MNKKVILLKTLVAVAIVLWSIQVTNWVIGIFKIKEEIKIEQFSKPYTIKIKDEHHAILRYEKDTVILFLENAYALGDQDIAFIYLSNNLKN